MSNPSTPSSPLASLIRLVLACALLSSSALFLHTSYAAQSSQSSKPWDHGRLKVDPTGRMLIHEDGHPFFWMGDSCWEFFHRATREDAGRYLADRAAKRFNVIQASAVAEFGAFDAPNAYGHLPFEKTKTHPRGDLGVPRLRPGANDDYWDHVAWIVDRAAEHGIYVCLVVSWGSPLVPWGGVGDQAVDEQNAPAFGAFIGRLMKDKPNVIYMLEADRDAESDGVDYRPILGLIARGIKNADPNHLMSTLPKYYDARSWFGGEDWLDFNMIQYRCPPSEWDPLNLVTAAWMRKPAIPFINVECNLEQNTHLLTSGETVDAGLCRREFYWYVFAGAFGHTYGHLALITWWDVKHPYSIWFTRPQISWHEALDSPGAREKRFARNLMESRPLLGRVPDPSLIASGNNRADNHLEACFGDGYAFLYLPAGRDVLVNMGRISGDQARAWWFNPRTGEAAAIGTFPNRGSRTFDPPGEPRLGNDWILVIDDASRNYPAPGSRDAPQAPRRPASPQAAPAPAHLVNGGFEKGDASWTLNGAALAPGAGVKGGAALVMKQGPWRTAEQRIAITPETVYAVSAQVRAENCKTPVGLMVFFIDESGREVGRRTVATVYGSVGYKPYALEVYAPAAARFLDVRLFSTEGGAGQASFDQISVTPAPQTLKSEKAPS